MLKLLRPLIVLLGLALLTANDTSAFAAAGGEKLASGSLAVANTRVGNNTRPSEEAVRENLTLRYDLASDSPVAAESAAESTTLFRAVMTPELESIQSLDAFANPAGLEVKYFSTSLEGAQSYASQATRAFGDGPFSFVQTSIPNSLITPGMSVTVDGGIQTIVVPTNLLPSLTRPIILGP